MFIDSTLSHFLFHVILQSVQALRTMFCFCPPFSVAGNQEGKTEQKGVAITHEILSRTLELPVLRADFGGPLAKYLHMQYFCQSAPLLHPLFP